MGYLQKTNLLLYAQTAELGFTWQLPNIAGLVGLHSAKMNSFVKGSSEQRVCFLLATPAESSLATIKETCSFSFMMMHWKRKRAKERSHFFNQTVEMTIPARGM